MAAALFRGRSCFNCVQLCRVVWRPQAAALFSSKPSGRNQPRLTHIKKAKPQPAVDVAKLVEQLFSQRRPGTAPPAAGKAQPARASIVSSMSDIPHLSKTNPSVSSVFPAASGVFKETTSTLNTAPLSPQSASSTEPKTPQPAPLGVTQDFYATSASSPTSATKETKLETAAEADELTASSVPPSSALIVEENVEKSSRPAATEEPQIETATGTSVETKPPPVETLETQASVVEDPVEPTLDTAASTVQTKNTDSEEVGTLYTSTVESSAEATKESLADTSITPLETPAAVAGGTVEPVAEAEADKNISCDAKDATLIESPVDAALPTVDAVETRAPAVEGPVEATVHATVDDPTEVRAKSVELGVDNISTVEPLLETTVEPPVEASPPPVATPEPGASVAEGAVETIIESQAVQTNSTDSGVNVPLAAIVEPLLETTVEAVASPLEIEAAVVDGPVEPPVETELTAFIQIAQESAVLPLKTKEESTIESGAESFSGNVAVEEGVSEAEHMTLESVTLHSVQASVESLKSDELLQTTLSLDERAEKRPQELMSVQAEIGGEHKAESSGGDEGEPLTKDSLSDDLRELEGETSTLVGELLCRVPAELSKTDAAEKMSSASDQTVGTNGERSQTEEKATKEEEDVTPESVTLAEVEAEVGILETGVLQEASDALEKEADVPAKDEKMEVEMAMEEVVFKDKADATDVMEAEIPVTGSEQGLTDTLLLELEPQNETIDQEAEKRSGEQEGSVSEAMSLESVTLAEVEASLGTLENESLGETSAHLEKEAQVLGGETRVEAEEGTASEEMTEVPNVDVLSEDLTDDLKEELLFTVPVPEAQTDQEVVGANISADLDPVQRLFLEKIREYNNLRSGEPVGAETDYERRLSEETAKLQRLYGGGGGGGGGDLSSFPQFTFTEPKMEPDS